MARTPGQLQVQSILITGGALRQRFNSIRNVSVEEKKLHSHANGEAEGFDRCVRSA